MDTQEAQREAAVRAARGAIQEHRWKDAFELLLEADAERPLEAADLEALAEAAWFNARADLSIEIKERAFRAHVDAGAPERAAIVAFDLGREYSLKRQFSIAAAWAGRGARLLEGRPDSAAHGYLALSRSHVHETAGDMDGAMEEAARAVEVGARFGDADLQAWGLIQRGSILIRLGRIDEGFTFMEEATIAAVNGELRPMSTGVVYCTMIAVCRDITDYGRAGEWTEAAKRWCERQAINGFPGVCRVHRGEILALQGALEQAERELLTATEEIALYNATPPLADGFYALGEIRMRLGDLAGAEEALRQAHSLGRSPQPALALIRLAEGKLKAAVSAIDSAVAEEQTDLWHRARLLPAQVEIAVANADPETARTAAEEIARISDTYRSPALHAAKHDSFGRVLLAEGDAESASRELRTAIRHWQEVGAPYEVARDRVVLSTVLRALGHDDAADLELETARSEFDRLGAALDLAAATEAIRAEQERRAAPTTTRKTFLFTDTVGSTNLAGAMGDEAWELLLRWHDDALRTLFVRYGGRVVNSTGDGFFVAFDTAARAIECAVAIQRALADHRRTSGFAPTVRIGVHTARATPRGSDYTGVGVHVAARIAALADGGQVLASEETANEATTSCPIGDRRAVTLKGVTTPIRVVTVSWDGDGAAAAETGTPRESRAPDASE